MHQAFLSMSLLCGTLGFTAWSVPLSAAATPDPGVRADVVHHDAVVSIDPAAGTLCLRDRVRLPVGPSEVVFALHEGLSPVVEGADVVARTVEGPTELLTLRTHGASLTITAEGRIVHPPVQVATEHQRSFQESIGTIEARGVYLAPESHWLPTLIDDDGAPPLVVGRVSVQVPPGWQALSEGTWDAKTSTWEQASPIEGFHLLAGMYSTFSTNKRGTEVLVWLRKTADGADAADAATLAQRYFEVTGQYLEQYEELIGKYPYEKFALVENFWETGYGMPSFTALGSSVLRFPFLLHTSWPHELLHNWWGNGVFPATSGGNWTEGLTAYLADYLHDEQQGRGAAHRLTILQRFQDFVGVDAERDFPLTDFTNRSSASTEAVGYGKTAFLFHMVRRQLGDAVFIEGLRRLWRERRFQRTTFAEVAQIFSSVAPSSRDMTGFFSSWTTMRGAPRLRLVEVATSQSAAHTGARRRLRVVVEQAQTGPVFPVDVPVIATLVDGRTVSLSASFPTAPQKTFGSSSSPRRATASADVDADVARVDVDPFFDVFRTLDPDEVPPVLSRALGAPHMRFVLPSRAPKAEREAWQAFATALCPDRERCLVVDDTDGDFLAEDEALWVLGQNTPLRRIVHDGVKTFGGRFDDDGFWSSVAAARRPPDTNPALATAKPMDPRKSALAVVVEHPKNRRNAVVFVAAPSVDHIALLARKLPHYGKYAFLGFTPPVGRPEALENTDKGTWASSSSPLSFRAPSTTASLLAAEPAALATLPPPLDGEAMHAWVTRLADPTLGGRGRGSAGLARAREMVAQSLRARGVQADVVCSPKDATLCNVVARIPGTDPSLPRVVLGAHLDHLPATGAPPGGPVFPGADDNASGVAVVTEVAASFRAQPGLRGLDVVLFDGEEDGRRGSKWYVEEHGPRSFFAMVNLDTVGRLAGRKLLVLDGDSATEWVHAVRGVAWTTGMQTELAPQGGGASDQQSFLERGIPALQLFSGPQPDYHRPSDTADRVEPSSLVHSAVVARELVAWLLGRREPLTWNRATTGAPAASPTTATANPTGARRAALGCMPDMTFAGPGVRMSEVLPGSAAASAGLRPGDVLVRFDDVVVADLKAYSDLLKSHAPGDRVVVVVDRAGALVKVDVILGAR
jgi:aminopeptidase N